MGTYFVDTFATRVQICLFATRVQIRLIQVEVQNYESDYPLVNSAAFYNVRVMCIIVFLVLYSH